MPGQTGSNLREEYREGGMRYVKSDLVHPCNLVSFTQRNVVADYWQLM